MDFGMKALRRAVAITLVSAAICADRQAYGALAARTEATCTQPTLAARLSVSFSRTVPTVRFLEARRDQDHTAIAAPAVPVRLWIVPAPLSPFRFRLPPPLA
jgi:hypothetical protein